MAPRLDRLLKVLGLSIAVGLPVGLALGELFVLYQEPYPRQPFTDGFTYLAAGERLNDGHALYELQIGDRGVDFVPALFASPLLSPPLVAVAWRPLAHLETAGVEIGLALWIAACWFALLGTVAFLVTRLGWVALAVAVVLSVPIAQQLAVANLASFFPGMLVAAWLYRSTPRSGVFLGLMTALKLTPISGVAWLAATGRSKEVIAAVATSLVAVGVGLVGAGWENNVAYPIALLGIGDSPLSLPSLAGATGSTYAVFVGGTVLTVLSGRWPRVCFGVAVVTMTLGSPALYLASLVTLLALLAPLLDFGRSGEGSAPRT